MDRSRYTRRFIRYGRSPKLSKYLQRNDEKNLKYQRNEGGNNDYFRTPGTGRYSVINSARLRPIDRWVRLGLKRRARLF